ncbi:MFS transporter [Paraferrimonas sp. SM1919]|uniref:MFS transporter n=1 Tax=Paraferrimonas sp. SM1919 TaxID=2662263 RepID=UPI0013D04F7A|nr:MFS transporter [Paraferrimonas sp. SM1919]
MKAFKPWYLAQSSIGVVQWVTVAILLTPIIIEKTGSGTLMGQVMAILGGFGIVAPLLGLVADKFDCHRLMQKLALLGHLGALITLYFAGAESWHYWLVGLLIGLGTVSMLVLNPAFIISDATNQEEEGQGLTRLFQSQFAGILVAGLLVAAMQLYQVPQQQQLLALMVLVVLSLLATSLFPPNKVKQQSDDVTEEGQAEQHQSAPTYIWVIFLVSVFFSMFLSSNLMEMGPIIIAKVFNVEMSSSAIGIALSALLTIVVLEPVGRWMQHSGPYKVWTAALGVYALVGFGLYFLIGTGVASFVPVLLIVALMQSISWFDMAIAAIAARLSPASPALTQGLLLLAMASGFAIGTLLAGIGIDAYGFESVITLSAIAISLAIVLASVVLVRKPK